MVETDKVEAAPRRRGFPVGRSAGRKVARAQIALARLLGEGRLSPYLFLLPFLVLYAIFLIFPIVQGLYVSLTDWDMMRPHKPFVGLDNFRFLFSRDSLFWPSVRATLAYIFLNVPVKIILGLVFALALNQKVRGTIAFRTAIFVPFVINTAAIGLLWQWILNSQVGMLNFYLGRLGLPPQRWLAEPTWTMLVVVGVTVWWSIAFNAVVFLAGLQDIPEEFYEAARIDGAGPWGCFWYITLPCLKAPAMFVTIMQIIGSFQAFGNIYMLTAGGPVDATRVLMIHLYETGFAYFRMGPAAAIAVILFIMVMVLTIIQLRLFRSRVED
jgi:multiple sugar transport system permease protein